MKKSNKVILSLVILLINVLFLAHQISADVAHELKTCIDSDGKANFYTSGNAKYWLTNYNNNPVVRYDRCMAGMIARDYYCPPLITQVEVDAFEDASYKENSGEKDIVLTSSAITGRTIDDASRVGNYLEHQCPLSCLNGRCIDENPAIDLFADYSPTLYGYLQFYDVVSINCQTTSVNDVNDIILTVKGYDAFNQLIINHQENFDCSGAICGVQEWINKDSTEFQDFEKTIPGRYEITCSAHDGRGNLNTKTKNFTTKCDTVCEDTAPPFIEEFSLTEFSNDFVWVNFKALDAVSGTDFMTLGVENKPQGSNTWNVVSDEAFRCTAEGCLRYKIFKGNGDWRANVQVSDKEGNTASQGTQDTMAQSTGVIEPPPTATVTPLPQDIPLQPVEEITKPNATKPNTTTSSPSTTQPATITESGATTTPQSGGPTLDEEPVVKVPSKIRTSGKSVDETQDGIEGTAAEETILDKILNFIKGMF